MSKESSPFISPPAGAFDDPFRVLVESIVGYGIAMVDAAGMVASWNAGAERLYGYDASEIIGRPLATVIPDLVLPDVRYDAAAPLAGAAAEHEAAHQARRQDGTYFAVLVSIAPMADAGGHRGYSVVTHDRTELRAREGEVARLTRLYAALSQVNQAILRTPGRDELFGRVCEALVEQGGFRMAWIGWHEPDSHRLLPVARCGDGHGYIERLEVASDDRPEGRGPTGTAFRTARPYVANDLSHEPGIAPWREQIVRHGFRSAAAFPVHLGGTVRGTLSVYGDRPDLFHSQEVALLTEAAANLSFALDNQQREEARRQAERTRLDEKRFTETMIESMPGIVYFYDATRRFLRWNRNLEMVSGYSADEIAGMHPLDFFAADGRAQVERRIAEVFEGGGSSLEAMLVAKDGTTTPYHFTGRRVRFEGQTCLIGVGIDIAARLAGEAERHKRERAEAADRVKSTFLATMSHELRTPLNSIIGFTGVLLQGLAGPLSGEQLKQLGMVRTSARHLLALVNDVLDISKIEAGQIDIGHEPFAAPRSIVKVVELVSPAAAKTGVALRMTIAPEVGMVVADERRFEQVLLNLLGNAVKFTERGEIVVAADVVVDAPSPAEPSGRRWLRVRVIDTGIGIRQEDLATLFQPFRQIDSGLSRKYEGTGLGLAISARLAELMAGRVDADSEWGRGSTFTVTLPLEAGSR